jgi:hypothetical protein
MYDQSYQPNMSGIPDWMPALSMGLGGFSDIMSLIQNQRQANRQRELYSLLQNPGALAARVNAMYVPLSAEARANVSRQVQGEMAMRGTADSRYADLASARAFSEIDTQRRNAVMDAYLNALGGSAGLTGQRAPIGGLGQALQQVMLLRGLGGSRPNPSPGIALNPGRDASADYSRTNYSNYDLPPGSFDRAPSWGPMQMASNAPMYSWGE